MRRVLVLALSLVACTPGLLAHPTQSRVASSASSEPSATVPPSRVAPEAFGCPVTLPASSWIADLANITPLPRSRFSWYGDSNLLAVDLPIDGVYRVNAKSSDLGTKVAWWRYLSGTVEITARRVDDGAPAVRTKTTAGYGATGLHPSYIVFTGAGL